MAGGSMRVARNISAGAVAVIAAFSSYSHTVHVALRCAERPEVAYALPVSVDGMLVVATVVMVDDKRRGHRPRPIARVAFAAGVAASLAANIAAAHPSPGARLVAAWPAIALLLVVEMLARPPAPAARQARPQTADRQPPPATAAPPLPQLPPPSRRQPPPPTAANPPRGARPAAPPTTPTTLAARRPSPITAPATSPNNEPPPAEDHTPGTTADRPKPAPAAATRRRRPATTTRQLARQIIDTEPDLTRAQIAARLGLSPRRLREILNQPP